MAKKIQNPNEKSRGFLYAVVGLLVVIMLVIGFIVINGRKHEMDEIAQDAQQTSINVAVVDHTIRLSSDATKDSAPVVDLYEDYSCPHCGELAKATDDDMLEAIEAGKLVVNIHSLNFLDRDNVGHSTLAGSAARAVADSGNANAYWNLRRHLFLNIEDTYGWDAKQFSQAAAAYGATDEVADEIKNGDDVETYREGATQDSEQLKKVVGKVSSPHIIKDGKDVEISKDWVAEVTK